MKTPAQGRCQCGATSYTLEADPLFIYACHCHTCQRRTGGACSVALVVMSDSLQVKGDLTPWSRTSDKGDTNTRYSCAGCGNVIYGVGETSPELAKLQSGTLDDTSDIEPEVHMWTQSKQSWINLAEGIGQFETQPEDPLELLQAALDYRTTKNNV